MILLNLRDNKHSCVWRTSLLPSFLECLKTPRKWIISQSNSWKNYFHYCLHCWWPQYHLFLHHLQLQNSQHSPFPVKLQEYPDYHTSGNLRFQPHAPPAGSRKSPQSHRPGLYQWCQKMRVRLLDHNQVFAQEN